MPLSPDRFEATYLIETPLDPAKVAEVMAGEQSCGTFARVEGETDALRERARATVVAIEELPPELLLGAYLEVEEKRFDGNGIRALYDSADYPLPRKAAKTKVAAAG